MCSTTESALHQADKYRGNIIWLQIWRKYNESVNLNTSNLHIYNMLIYTRDTLFNYNDEDDNNVSNWVI